MLAVGITEEGGLAEGFLMDSEAMEVVLAWYIRDIRQRRQARGIDEAGSRERWTIGGACDLPCFVRESGDVCDGGVEVDTRAESAAIVDVGVDVVFQVGCYISCWEEIVVLVCCWDGWERAV